MSGVLFRPQCFSPLPSATRISAVQGSYNLYFNNVYFGFDIWFSMTSNVGDRSLNLKYTWVAWAPRTVGLVGSDIQCWPELWNWHMYINPHGQKNIFIFCFCFEYLLFVPCIMSCQSGNELNCIEIELKLHWNWHHLWNHSMKHKSMNNFSDCVTTHIRCVIRFRAKHTC